MNLAVMRRSRIVCGYLVALSIMVSKNEFPLEDLGRGPTQSITIWLKGSPTTGIGCKGAGLMLGHGLPVI